MNTTLPKKGAGTETNSSGLPKGLTVTNIIVIVITVLISGGYLSSFFSSETTTPMQAEEWTQYDFAESRFSVSLPSKPLRSSTTTETPLYDEVHIEKYQSSSGDGSSYIVQVLTYPEDDTTPLEEFITRMFQGGPAVEDVTLTTFDGHEAADFKMDLNFNGMNVKTKGRVVRVDNALYMLMAGEASDRQYRTFLDSFVLLSS